MYMVSGKERNSNMGGQSSVFNIDPKSTMINQNRNVDDFILDHDVLT